MDGGIGVFQRRVEQLPELLRTLLASQPISLAERAKLPNDPAIYLISEGTRHLYVGRTKKVRQRMRNHTSGNHNQSTFAFKLARETLGITKASYTPEGSRASLSKQDEFGRTFAETTARVKKMNVQFIKIEDDILQTLLEVYCALALKTPYNEFRTS